MEWLDESERNLDSDVEIANEPDKIKTQLTQHKVIKTFISRTSRSPREIPICLTTLYWFIRCKILRVNFGSFVYSFFFFNLIIILETLPSNSSLTKKLKKEKPPELI